MLFLSRVWNSQLELVFVESRLFFYSCERPRGKKERITMLQQFTEL